VTTTAADETLQGVRGPVLRPGDPGFAEEVSGFNLAHRPSPSIVVGATCADDVAAAVSYARRHGLRVHTQATGHGLRSDVTDAVMITTRRMNSVTIDPRHHTATFGAGVTWRQVLDAAAEHGLAPLCGSSSQVGAVAYTLGGGVGALGRRYGYAADQVRSMSVVTADGRPRYLDVMHHAELFWALRGARDGFAVVTGMTVNLFPVATVHGGGVFFDGAVARDVLHRWRRWAPLLPDHVGTSVALLRLPPDPAVPEPLRGRFVVHVRFTSTGTASEAAELLEPLRAQPGLLIDTVAPTPFREIDQVHADPTHPMPAAETGTGLSALEPETIDALLSVTDAESGCGLVMVELRLLGGAFTREPWLPGAVPGRATPITLAAVGVLAGPAAELVPSQLQAVRDSVRPWSCTAPLNFSGTETVWDVRDTERLTRIRSEFDPARVFAAV